MNSNDRPRFIFDDLILGNKSRKIKRKINRAKKSKKVNNNVQCNTEVNSRHLKTDHEILNNSKVNNKYFDYQKESYDKLEGAPIIKKDLYIGNVASGSVASIGDYIKSNGFNFIKLEKVSRDFSRFKSFRLTVTLREYNYFMRSEFWPTGFIVKPWINFKNKKRYGVKEYFNKNFSPMNY